MTDFRINVIVDPRNARAGISTVEKELTGLESTAKSVGQTLRQAFGFLAAGVVLKSSIALLAGFEQEMATVGAITNATANEFADLTAEAERLGLTTRFTATQAAEGMGLLARAGFDVRETLEAVDDTLVLAQAGALGLAEAADISSSVLRGFRLETDQAGRVVDVLAQAANSTNADVRQLGEAMKFAAPVAAGLGVSLEETTAAVGALSNAGLQASLAGTGLRRVLSELESPSDTTRELLAQVGLSADDVKVSSVGLTNALVALKKAGVDTGLALEIFGDRGGPAFEVLGAAIPDVVRLTQEFEGAEGSAKRVADAMDDNLNGALLAVRASFNGVILALGKAGATKALEGSLRGLAATLRLVAENMDVVASSVLAAGAAFAGLKVAPVIASFIALQSAISAGDVVILGSAIAQKQMALATVEAAAAQVAQTEAKIAALAPEVALAQAILGTNATLVQQGVLQAELTANTAALTAAQASLATASRAAAVEATVFGRVFIGLKNVIAAHPIGAAAVAVGVLAGALVAFIPDVESAADKTKRFRGELVDLTGTIERLGELRAQREVFTTIGATADEFANNAKAQLQALEDVATALVAKGAQGAQAVDLSDIIKIVPDAPQEVVDALIKQGQDARDKALAALESSPATEQGLFDTLFGIDTGEVERTAATQVQGNVDIAAALDLVTSALIEQRAAVEALDEKQPDNRARIGALAEVRRALDEEAALLTLSAAARERANQQLEIEDDLREKGISLSGEERAALADRLRVLQALTDQANVLDAIQQPHEDYRRTVEALNALLAAEAISQEEYNIALRDAQAALGGMPEILRNLNVELEAERGLVGATAVEREVANEVLRAESELRRKLTEEERAQIELLTEEKLALQDQAAVLASITGPQEQFARTQAALNALLADGVISAEQYAKALLDAKVAAGDLSNTASGGLKAGLDQVEQKLSDLSGAVQGTVVNAFGAAEDQITSFLSTGEASFSAFVDSVIADVSRLLARQALLALVQALTSGAGGGAGSFLTSIFGGAKAVGGDVEEGMTYLVGEQGPELFTPPDAGTIVPAGETAALMAGGQQEAPEVNVDVTAEPQVIVVKDEDEALRVIESGRADDALVTRMGRNPSAFSGALGR